MKGKITLVGAGPGDLGLLTLKGKRAVEDADVIVYDRLIGEDILSLASENAEKINAGKECGNHLIPQDDINKILIEKAKEGKNVVRLKGGDCFVFGRGGEELLEAYKNGIDFEVVPGVTSALAVPAYGGIPATHRDFSSSVHIITGHFKQNRKLNFDFESLVKLNATLIFLMGLNNLDFIVNGLISAGMDTKTPCSVIQNGTQSTQKSVVSYLDKISNDVKKAQIKSPAVIIIGQVCTLADKLNWFDRLPLRGKKIIVTRSKDRIAFLSQRLKELGAEVIELPCIKIKSNIDKKISFDDIKEKIMLSQWIVFTSPSGVCVFFDKVKEKKLDARILSDKKIAVIGSGTQAQLLKYNLRADLIPEKYYIRDLANALVKAVPKEDKICILRSEKGSAELNEILKNNNREFFDLGIYETLTETESKNIDKINTDEVDFVTFTSSSTVSSFCEVMKNAGYENFSLKAVCIGDKTAHEAKKRGFDCFIASEPSIEAVINKLIEMHGKKFEALPQTPLLS